MVCDINVLEKLKHFKALCNEANDNRAIFKVDTIFLTDGFSDGGFFEIYKPNMSFSYLD